MSDATDYARNAIVRRLAAMTEELQWETARCLDALRTADAAADRMLAISHETAALERFLAANGGA